MFRSIIKINEIHRFITKEIRSISTKSLPVLVGSEPNEKKSLKKQILQKYLGLTYPQAVTLMRKNKFLHNIRNHRLESAIEVLQKMGVSSESIRKNPLSMNYIDHTIEHNIMYLKEAGFKNIDAQTFLRFRSIVKKPISVLKVHGYIEEETNVIERLCSYLNPNPSGHITLDELSDEDSIITVHEIIFKKYIVWRLKVSEEDINRIFNTYDGSRFRSFQLISEMLDLLISYFKFDAKKILHHGYLLETNPKSVQRMMKTFPKLGLSPIKEVLFRYPKLMTVSVDNMKEILKHLKKFRIPDEALQRCFNIFTLSSDSVLQRLNELKKIPEFEVLAKNSRILLLVLFQNKAKIRLELLRNLNVKCASLHVLCASDSVFEKYAQDGSDRTKGSDMVNYLSVELGKSFNEIRDGLSINNNWYHVPATAAKNTLTCLRQMGYKRNDIAKTPVLLLYTREQLEDTFKEMKIKLEANKTELTKRQELNLCLYMIEKKYHFSGNALWGNNQNNVKSDLEQEDSKGMESLYRI